MITAMTVMMTMTMLMMMKMKMMMMTMITAMKINAEDDDCVNTVLILMLHVEGPLTGGDSAPQ